MNFSQGHSGTEVQFVNRACFPELTSGTGDSQRDSRESIRANRFAIETRIFIARQADSHESLEFPIRANHATKFLRKNIRIHRNGRELFSLVWFAGATPDLMGSNLSASREPGVGGSAFLGGPGPP